MSRGGPTRLVPEGAFDSRPLGFSPVVIAPAGGRLVFVSGQLARDQRAGFEQQVDEAFDALEAALAAAGAGWGDVLKITCLVVGHDTERRDVVSRARRRRFGDSGPASTIVPVPRLAGETALFEVDAVAAVPDER